MERLRTVEAISVGGAHLISVSVLLSAPTRTIPVLSVGGITTSQRVHSFFVEVSVLAEPRLTLQLGESESGFVLKSSRPSSSSKSRMGLDLWRYERSSVGGGKVVRRMVQRVRLVSSLSSVTTRQRFTSVVLLGNQLSVEPSGRECILGEVDGLVEDASRLFSHGLLNVVVGLHLGAIASIPRNGARLARGRSLCAHVSSASSVEIICGPGKELSLVHC